MSEGDSPLEKRKRYNDEDEDLADSISLSPKRRPRPSKDAATATAKSTPSPRKIPRPYAPPETYAHLRGIGDHFCPNLRVVFCGINPGKMSAERGAAYANPSNRFWKMIHYGGFTPDRICKPEEDRDMPRLYRIGMTNLVDRVTSEQSELSGLEMRVAVPAFLEKLERWQPLAVVMVGKKIWDELEAVIKRSLGELGTSPVFRVKEEAKVEEDVIIRSASQSGPDTMANTLKAPVKPEPPDEKEAISPIVSKSPNRKPRFMWEEPRPYKLVHRRSAAGEAEKATLFWVVPSTSGLERTLMPDRIAYASAINKQIDDLEAGLMDISPFHPIHMDGIPAVAEEMRRKGETARARKIRS